MKKKCLDLKKDSSTVSEPEIAYEKISISENRSKSFRKTACPEDFPTNCVTLDTFFSDLEDYIHENEQIQNRDK